MGAIMPLTCFLKAFVEYLKCCHYSKDVMVRLKRFSKARVEHCFNIFSRTVCSFLHFEKLVQIRCLYTMWPFNLESL